MNTTPITAAAAMEEVPLALTLYKQQCKTSDLADLANVTSKQSYDGATTASLSEIAAVPTDIDIVIQ